VDGKEDLNSRVTLFCSDLPSPFGCEIICEPQSITYLSGCLRVQLRMSTAPVYISILLCIYVCKIIVFVNFQD